MAPPRRTPASVTGREGYIVGKALLYAIAQIQSLPAWRQEFSDMCDMCALVRAMGINPLIIADVEGHLGRTIDVNVDREDRNPDRAA